MSKPQARWIVGKRIAAVEWTEIASPQWGWPVIRVPVLVLEDGSRISMRATQGEDYLGVEMDYSPRAT
jgi:hypothetical protein